MTALVIIGILLWLFWPSRSKWHPFAGFIKHDKRTGATSLVFTLPGRHRKGRRR